MSPEQHIADRVADGASILAGGAVLFGLSIGEVNKYLQAISFLVGIFTGLCAAVYYIKKANRP